MKTKTTAELPYRACVGIALFNSDGKIFVAERIDSPGSWQMPQGGIDDGETVEDAFRRELLEEVGTDKAEIIRIYDKKLRYSLPPHLLGRLWNGKYAGQEQTWVAARFTGNDADINIYHHHFPEFQAWQWVMPDESLTLIVPFKRETYREVLEAFRDISSPAVSG